MNPEWHQQPSNKSLQPPHLPQFEVVGQQKDHKNYEEASRMVITRAIGISVCLLAFIFLITLDSWDSLFKTPETFAQLNTSASNQFEGKVKLTRHSIERQPKLKGFLFDTKPRKSPDGTQFQFVVLDISVTNRSQSKLTLNIYSMMLVTGKNKYYSPDLHTRSYKGGLKNNMLDPGETQRGFLIYHIPVGTSLKRIELRGGQSGPLAVISI